MRERERREVFKFYFCVFGRDRFVLSGTVVMVPIDLGN